MANLKDIRIRINSVSTTRQVTSAMKMVSAAKFKKAQDDVEHVRPFVAKLLQIVNFLAKSVDDIEERYAGFRVSQKGKVLIIPVASNKGLAGAFNSNVIKETERMLRNAYSMDYMRGNVDILPIGKQVSKGLKSRGFDIAADCNDLLDNLTRKNIYDVIDKIAEQFFRGVYREVHIVYNEFVNAAVQNVVTTQLLPLKVTDVELEGNKYSDFLIEPTKEDVIEALVPQAIRSIFFATLMESAAAEHGARMTSMHKATDNATELLAELQLQYNKARQSAITGELIEIVSGAEALNN